MTLRIPAKVLLHVWSYDSYDMTLSTGKQRRHMINSVSEEEVKLKEVKKQCIHYATDSSPEGVKIIQ